MRKLFLFALSLGVSAPLLAQNLVLNPGFIPSKDSRSEAQLFLAPGYSNANAGTSDLYSRSASKYEVGIPNNFVGSQDVVGADYYAGIIAYYGDESFAKEGDNGATIGYGKYAEYLQVSLREPMEAGARYKVRFDASLADNSAFACALGVYFAPKEVNDAENAQLALDAQINSQDVISDKTNWTNNSYEYLAKGGEQFLIVGRFGNSPVVKVIAPNTNNNKRAYYYLSNFNVEKVAEAPVLNQKEVSSAILEVNFDNLLKGNVFVLPHLNFETSLSAIETKAYEDLDKLAVWMRAHPEAKIKIEGHTDRAGSESFNQKLSLNRAVATKKYLLHKGVKAEAIRTTGFGSSRLLQEGPKENIVNRRVEISLQ